MQSLCNSHAKQNGFSSRLPPPARPPLTFGPTCEVHARMCEHVDDARTCKEVVCAGTCEHVTYARTCGLRFPKEPPHSAAPSEGLSGITTSAHVLQLRGSATLHGEPTVPEDIRFGQIHEPSVWKRQDGQARFAAGSDHAVAQSEPPG